MAVEKKSLLSNPTMSKNASQHSDVSAHVTGEKVTATKAQATKVVAQKAMATKVTTLKPTYCD